MARSADGQDYFVSEPALACLPGRNYLSAVLPIRWFIRGGALWAKAHQLIRETSDSYFIDATATLDVPLSSFQFNILHFGYAYKRYGMPDPRHISGEMFCFNGPKMMLITEAGILRKVEEDLQPIALPLLNPWRAKAKGRRVFSTPIWTWCDDTSGNESKKWNKHNSYLFTLAGLPREQAHSMYNIHFLATSNLAHPLEMMAGIQEQIRYVYLIYSGIQASESFPVMVSVTAYQPGTVAIKKKSCSYPGFRACLGTIPCTASYARM
jgi:hypothetical protein